MRMSSAAGLSGIFVVCLALGLPYQAAGQATGAGAAARTAARAGLLPGTKQTILATISGSAMNADNGPMPDTLVRLRDARLGRIVQVQTTDPSGLFTFRGVDPGTYIVEMMGPQNSTVLATSQLLSVNAGEAISTVVKLPFRIPAFAALLGQTTQTAAAQAVISVAASTGVLTSGPLDVCVSGPCQ